MKTRFDQILKKINLSKSISMNYVLWETTIDDLTIDRLKYEGYSVSFESKNNFYYISW